MAKSISFHNPFINHDQRLQTGAVNETLIALDLLLSARKIFRYQQDMSGLDMEPCSLAEIKTRVLLRRDHACGVTGIIPRFTHIRRRCNLITSVQGQGTQ